MESITGIRFYDTMIWGLKHLKLPRLHRDTAGLGTGFLPGQEPESYRKLAGGKTGINRYLPFGNLRQDFAINRNLDIYIWFELRFEVLNYKSMFSIAGLGGTPAYIDAGVASNFRLSDLVWSQYFNINWDS